MMKLLTLILTILALNLSSLVYGQSAAYKASMKKSLQLFEQARGKNAFLKAAQSFDALALSEKREWLPYYYAGLCRAIGAFSAPQTEIDDLCDQGTANARVADSLSPGNSEIDVLKAMLVAARIGVDEKKRGQKYGMQVSKEANRAVKSDPSNPRAYLLKGRALLFTPEALGGGARKARPVFETALEKFKSFRPASEFAPVWGLEEVEKELKALKAKLPNH